MDVRELRCGKCSRLLLNELAGEILFGNSTDHLDLTPTLADLIMEIKCSRCKRYSVMYKLRGEEDVSDK